MMKLMGKSSYGKCITDFLKHETAKIVTGDNYIKNIRRNNYIEHQDMNKGCEFRFKKMSFKQKVIKPSLKDEFKKNRHLWLERDDTIENKVYDSRTPGLFKLEYEGNCIISLASKMYYYDENKFSSKGINKEQNEITKQKYVDALKGLLSAQKLYLKLDKQVPMKAIQDFLQKQQVHQLHQNPRSVPSFKSINVYSVNDQWQIDLIDFSKYSRWNSGFKYLFCGVDVFSRKAFVVAIKSKTDTTEAMRFVFATRNPILVQSDNGTEFLNNSFQQLLKDHHKGINDTPESRYQANPKTGTIKSKALNTQIKIGDKVRILIEKGTFTKELKKNYKYYQLKKIKSSETFTVEQVERERPMTNIQRRNKRELDELERLEEPESKKRKNWDSYSTEQQEQLKKWYRDYYSQNKESERQRYRTYYALHSVTERERLNKYKKPKN
ncbi:hypothetical protein BDEG_27638 [Batrachochytrium dendrobatidis JEL423]|uniref:Integrase catalytic domain-containing protein n=1 Tax=Batrachochytrium dendrobatidis (strain JEL423) TaxID=403673 RepID=A0A177WYE0_BATDL|nr:hypothetical protein BDEG_27638 [Batrachochytrium dendrobatidis JEL423]